MDYVVLALIILLVWIRAFVLWKWTDNVTDWKIRRLIRTNLIISVVPIIILGHPPIVAQIWMLPIYLIVEKKFAVAAFVMLVWVAIIALAMFLGWRRQRWIRAPDPK